MVYGVVGSLMREFGASATGWVVSSFLLVGRNLRRARLATRGHLRAPPRGDGPARAGGDRILINALSTNLTGLIIGRSIQGVAAAFLPLCIGLAREYFPAARVPKAIGWLTAIASFSAMLGILLGGALADTVGWRSTFWVAAAHALLSLVCVALAAAAVPRLRPAGTPSTGSAASCSRRPLPRCCCRSNSGRRAAQATCAFSHCFAVGVLLLASWVRRELRHSDPMIDVRQLGTRQLGLTMLLMGLFGVGSSPADADDAVDRPAARVDRDRSRSHCGRRRVAQDSCRARGL